MISINSCSEKRRSYSVGLSVIESVVCPSTLPAVTSSTAFALSFRVEDQNALVCNLVSVPLDVKARALQNFND